MIPEDVALRIDRFANDFDALTSAIQNKSLQLRYFLMDVVRRPDVSLTELRNYIVRLPFKSKESILSTYDKILEEEVSVEEARAGVAELRAVVDELTNVFRQMASIWGEYIGSGRAAVLAPTYSIAKVKSIGKPAKRYAKECWRMGLWSLKWGSPAEYGISIDPNSIRWAIERLETKPSPDWIKMIKHIAEGFREEDKRDIINMISRKFGR